MKRVLIGIALCIGFANFSYASSYAENSLLELCDSFGETRKECQCYMGEVKQVFTPADIELGGSISRAFLKGEEPEAIAVYLLMTRRLTVTRAAQMYKLGDAHTERVGKKCEDPTQKITTEMKAKREAMAKRLEKMGARYRIGS